MAVHLGFAGWFQCRLSTDPDPYDEPRGVTGSTFALPGEPDLDRVIRFGPEGATVRPGCEPIAVGVAVDRVTVGDAPQDAHPLLGAPVRLADQDGRSPVFEGRNSVVAGDGIEPIVPLAPRVGDGPAAVGRAAADAYTFPFTRVRARFGLPGLSPALPDRLAFVRAVTGLDIAAAWPARAAALEALVAGASPAEAAALRHRIAGLRAGNPAGGFAGIMSWAVALVGPAEVGDPAAFPAPPDVGVPWGFRLWLGAWDPDALCGYAVGVLTVPTAPTDATDPPADWWDRRP